MKRFAFMVRATLICAFRATISTYYWEIFAGELKRLFPEPKARP